MNRKRFNEFMNSSHSIYLILPFAALWSAALLFEGKALFFVFLGVSAVGFALLAVKDYLDERRTNPWLKMKPEEDRKPAPYEADMTER